jgi:hypothetical protein
MWALNWLPDIVFHLILIAGVLALLAGWALRMVPLISKYALPIQVVGVLLTILGVWYEGGIAKDAEWKARVAELQVQVAEAEAKAATVNTKVVERVVTKTRVIKEKADTVVQYIDREIKIADDSCKITPAVVRAHDAAAQNKSIAETAVPSATAPLTPQTTVNTSEIDRAAQSQPKRSWRDFLPKQ